MDFEDKQFKIIKALSEEWASYDSLSWGLFIDEQDLGISFVPIEYSDYYNYDIVDEKKWALARIKYGI